MHVRIKICLKFLCLLTKEIWELWDNWLVTLKYATTNISELDLELAFNVN